MMERTAAPILALAGGAGSGKSTIARELAEQIPQTRVVSLDLCYHTDPDNAPSVHRFHGDGWIVDFSNPDAIDPTRVDLAISAANSGDPGTPLIIVEGTFALTLPYVRNRARWTAYVDVPADIRIARKTLRKISEGNNPVHVLRGYLERGRAAHDRHIAPSRQYAAVILDGTQQAAVQVKALRDTIESTPVIKP